MTGKFISFESTAEGAGKTTQIRLLRNALTSHGLEVVLTREPGGSPNAEEIRSMILNGEKDKWTPESEALLFAAARADHVAKVIRPALSRGAWVLSDRFVDSSFAYQGAADGLGVERIRMLHAFGGNGLLPDRTILLELPASIAKSRADIRNAGKADRIEGRSVAYHDLVGNAFRELAANDPKRFRIVAATGTQEEVHQRIKDALSDLA